MKEDMKQKILDSANDEIMGLLKGNIDAIIKALEDAIQNHAAEKQLKYGINIGLILEPMYPDMKVSAKLSFAVKFADESIGTIASTQPELPLT